MEEVWLPIDGYEGYQVSNYCRIKSLTRTKTCKGNGIWKVEEKIMKPHLQCGYLRVGLCKNGVHKQFFVHVLGMNAFMPNINNLPEINHKDENKTNNFIWVNEDGTVDPDKSNLEYCDKNYNANYGTRNTRIKKAQGVEVNRFSKDGVYIDYFESAAEAERVLKIPNQNINKCCQGKRKTAGGYIWRYKEV